MSTRTLVCDLLGIELPLWAGQSVALATGPQTAADIVAEPVSRL